MSAPGAVEAWLRTNVPDADTLIYDFVDSTLDRYSVTVGTDGLLHAIVALSGVCCTNVTMVGPNIPVTDGFWHYVVVDFANSFIYVDLTRGPQGTGGGGGSFGPSGFGTASTSLGGTNFDGQLDEVAVYDAVLSSSRMSAHASAGGLGWDAAVAGGEEGSPDGCPEIGVFHKGADDRAGTINYTADGVLNHISTRYRRPRCGTSTGLPPSPNWRDPQTGKPAPRPTFTTGQTVRVKTFGDTRNYYVEWGPIQYKCTATDSRCYGLFFNMKAGDRDEVNHTCWIPFKGSEYDRLLLENCPTPSTAARNAINTCPGLGVGTHGWNLEHNRNPEDPRWVASFLCRTAQNPTWVAVFTHPDALGGTRWTSGWPDLEGFVHRLHCPHESIQRFTCWRREGDMAETHTMIRHRDVSTSVWREAAYAVCRKDDSLRWDARQAPDTAPLASWEIYEDTTHSHVCGG